MGELEDKLNSILSSPEQMERIMNLARSFSSSSANAASSGQQEENKSSNASLSAAQTSGGLDPKMMGLMTRLLGEYSSHSSDKAALLTAISPYLKSERREVINKAAEMARLARLARIAFSELNGGDQIV